LEKECEPQLEETVAELRAMNELLYRCFKRTVAWLRHRQAQDAEMLDAYWKHCAARGMSPQILMQYYMPNLCDSHSGRVRWSHSWNLCRTLRQNAGYLIDSVYWGAQNMAALDQTDRIVELAKQERETERKEKRDV
jgi:hypothetical protein